MNSDLAIKVNNLSKLYHLGEHAARAPYKTLRDALSNPFRRFRRVHSPQSTVHSPSSSSSDLWALKDVNFTINRGEVVGIIGRNGAGKSTLLKILSRITDPTEGQAELHGRVGSLLEVGTGFHPELTGRENIFLNGAILGMKRAEITTKFDEIVAFSEVERFIDTPVKFYSSGMYVRLAFAVAAHLEPEILLVDEVLAVGDAAFQKKCLGKMGDVAKQGRTVLFVSHNMGAIQNLCPRAVLIANGQVELDGESSMVINHYLNQLQPDNSTGPSSVSHDGSFSIERIVLKDTHGTVTTSFRCGEDLSIDLHYLAKRPIIRPYLWLSIYSQHGAVCGASMTMDAQRPDQLVGHGTISCTFHRLPLMPQQTYLVWLGARQADGQSVLLRAREVASFRIMGTAADLGFSGERAESDIGSVAPVAVAYTWELPGGKIVPLDPIKNAIAKSPKSHLNTH